MDMDRFRDLALQAIASQKLTVAEAARRSGVSYDTIRDLKRGKQLTTSAEKARKIATGLGFIWHHDEAATEYVSVAGRVGAGAEVDLYDAYPKGEGLYRVACPPQISSHGIVAVEVAGESMVPVYQPGTVLFYSRTTMGVPTEALGRICVCEDSHGRAWVKQVKTGQQEGTFSLISINPMSETLHGVHLKWAAPVRFSLPPEYVERHEG